MLPQQLSLAVILLGLLILIGCSDQAASPEAQIRALIDQGEADAEAREFGKLKNLIASDYSDNHGFDKKAAERILRLYLFRNQSIHMLTRIHSIALPEPRQADVKLTIAVAGTPATANLLDWRAEVVSMDLILAKDDDDWKVVRATWERGNIGDLL